ncbi:hypothetical protein [Aquibacillus saliphilus]|uniref:hypothetical protein n=1 Tax=Aquibacillus saliphilus TaxID=1909422 RepID=UPI001CF0290B|nr:hypothetical protein [Aquibacillus saliphilus]
MKQTYYISIDSGRIDKEKLGETHTYFEVEVDDSQLYELEYLLKQVLAMDHNAKSIFTKPLSEKNIDNERDTFQKNLKQLYEKIYEFGTNETRSSIRSLGIGVTK